MTRLLGLALLIVCLGALTAACGGGQEAASGKTGDGSPTTTGDGSPTITETEPPGSTSTSDDGEGGPGNPTFRRGKLKKGDCGPVKEETETVLQESTDAAALAEARLYHGLATAICGGEATAAEQEIEAVDADQLSPESRQVLEQVTQKGVPRTTAEFRDVLRAAAIAPSTGGASR